MKFEVEVREISITVNGKSQCIALTTRGHFYKGFMTSFFDKSFLQAMEFISMKFDKPLVVILMHQSKKVLVQTQNGSTSNKNH